MRRSKRMLEQLNEEIREHIERETQDNIGRGMPPEEAHYAAVRKFGNVTRVKEEIHELWSIVWFEQLLQDMRFGLRMLRKSPGFTTVAAGILALAIGANTAIFSAVYAVLLRPLPYASPQQLVVVLGANLKEGVKQTGISYPDFEELRAQNHVFSETSASAGHSLTLTGAGDPAEVKTEVVTPGYFALLGVRPLLGRTFLSEEGKRGAAPVVVLSENLWRERFGADPRILGNSITLDKRSFTVVGVMPGTFRSPVFVEAPRDIWIPIVQDPLFSGLMTLRNRPGFGILARLRPGLSGAQVQAEMDAISARLEKEWPAADSGWTLGIVPLERAIAGTVKTALLVLLGAVATVLLIACVNIANLFLTRATTRAREMGIRVALGAGRNRIVRQLLTESVVLGLVGGTLGVFLAYGGVRELSSVLPSGFPRVQDIRVDGWVLGLALLLSVGAGVLFGVAPGFFAAGSDVQASLREGSGQAGQGGVRHRARNLLAVAEVALAMVLLVAAGLLIRSFATLTSVNPGFEPDHLLKAEVSLPQFEYSTPQQWTAFSSELLTRIQAEPGMRNSAIAVPLPLADGPVTLGFEIEGNPEFRTGVSRTADYVAVSPAYFGVMQIPLLRGRLFSEQDAMPAPRVAVISEALARLYFPDQDPIGKRMTFGFPPNGKTSRQIVGIVGNVRDVSLHQEPGPMMYVPFAQAPFWGAVVVARTTLSTSRAANAIRQEVRSIDKDLPVTDIESMTDALSASVAQPRFGMFLLSLFAALALILAAAGVFGVISYSVSSRTREVGIRVALGAARGKILRLILSESAKLVLLGLALGIGGALALGRFLRTLLFEVRSTDPLTFAAVSILLGLVALAAAYVPARRATRVDPMAALRHE
jgi:putative ABC transport system permease protein